MTTVITSIDEWQTTRKALSSRQIGFVPTMGNLHPGHVSLLQRSKQENEVSILSIFVNPTQFNDQSDFQHYPRTVDEDIKLAQEIGIEYVLLPSESKLYPDGYQYKVTESKLSLPLEGQCRPGHFEGMLTIVLKLLLLTQPTRLYLGEKDYQQLLLIKGMIQAFFLNIEVVPCPTVRLPCGLPLSSRNNLLTASQWRLAEQFSQCMFSNKHPEILKSSLIQAGLQVEYVEKFQDRLFAAVKIDNIRLIDNIPLNTE